METLKQFLPYLSLIVAFLVFLVDIVLIVLKVRKIGSTLTPQEQATVKELESLQKVLTEVVPQAITLAEKSGTVSGPAKKLVALSQVMLECSKLGLDYAKHADEIDSQVERDIKLTKSVNV